MEKFNVSEFLAAFMAAELRQSVPLETAAAAAQRALWALCTVSNPMGMASPGTTPNATPNTTPGKRPMPASVASPAATRSCHAPPAPAPAPATAPAPAPSPASAPASAPTPAERTDLVPRGIPTPRVISIERIAPAASSVSGANFEEAIARIFFSERNQVLSAKMIQNFLPEPQYWGKDGLKLLEAMLDKLPNLYRLKEPQVHRQYVLLEAVPRAVDSISPTTLKAFQMKRQTELEHAKRVSADTGAGS